MKIKYVILYNAQDYSILYNITDLPNICEGWQFTHKWKAFA